MDYTPTQVATAIMLYMHNRAPREVVKNSFPNVPEESSYFSEWIVRFHKGFGPFYGHLDNDHREAFVTHALEAYGAEVRR